jgi:hypothetical protein
MSQPIPFRPFLTSYEVEGARSKRNWICLKKMLQEVRFMPKKDNRLELEELERVKEQARKEEELKLK